MYIKTVTILFIPDSTTGCSKFNLEKVIFMDTSQTHFVFDVFNYNPISVHVKDLSVLIINVHIEDLSALILNGCPKETLA